MNDGERLSIKTITGPDPAKFTESTEASGPGLRNLSEKITIFRYRNVAPGPVQMGKRLL